MSTHVMELKVMVVHYFHVMVGQRLQSHHYSGRKIQAFQQSAGAHASLHSVCH